MPTHYQTLNTPRTATPLQIRQAYRQRCLKTQPDKLGNTPSVHAAFVAVQTAYEVLSDAVRRAAYDATLSPEPTPTPQLGPSQGQTETGYAKFCTLHTHCSLNKRIPHNASFVSGGRKYCLCSPCRTSYLLSFFTDLTTFKWICSSLLSLLEDRVLLEQKYPAMWTQSTWINIHTLHLTISSTISLMEGTFTAGLEEVIFCPMCNWPADGRFVQMDAQRVMMRGWGWGVRKVEEIVVRLMSPGGVGVAESKELCWKLTEEVKVLCGGEGWKPRGPPSGGYHAGGYGC